MKNMYDYAKEKTSYPYFEIKWPLHECPKCKKPGMLGVWTNWHDENTGFELIVEVEHIPVDESGGLSDVHELCELQTLPLAVEAR